MAKRRNNRKWIIGGVILIVIVGAVIGIVVLNNNVNNGGESDESNGNSTQEEGNYSDEARAKIEKMEEEEKTDSVNYDSTITGTITHQAVENERFSLRIAMDQPIDSEGACRLSINLDGAEKYSDVVLMSANSSYYSCSFNVSLSGFNKGHYNYEVKLEANSQSGNVQGEFIYE